MVLPSRHLHWELSLHHSHALVAVLLALAKCVGVMNLVVYVIQAVLALATLPAVHVAVQTKCTCN